MTESLRGRAVLIVGGGTIGRAVARSVVDAGGALAITRRGDDASADGIALDVRDQASVHSAIRDVESTLGALHALVYCAAPRTLPGDPSLALRELLDVKVEGCLRVYKAASRLLGQRPGSSMVVLGGSHANVPGGPLPSTVANAAVQSLTRVLALEMKSLGGTANCVSPGPVDSPRFHANNPSRSAATDLLAPDAVASVIAFLLSPAAAAINGQIVMVGGSP